MTFAYYEADYKHKHYQGAQSEIEIMDELKDKQAGFYIKVFFVNDKPNMNDWQITWEGIKQDIGDVVGVPIVLQDDMMHPDFEIQNFFAKGTIVDYTLDEVKREAQVIARILDIQTIQLIREGKIKFVSPAVIARDSQSIEEVDGVDKLSRWIALHLALVADPAYGKKDAKISGTCTGKGHTCTNQLKKLSSPVAKELVGGKQDDCVDRKIPIVMKDNPKMSHDQAIAIAISMCKENSNVADSSAEPLTQTPLMKKLVASVHRIESEFNQMLRQAALPEHNGEWGNWINKEGLDIFVANSSTVDEAIKEQCGCSQLQQ